VTAFVFMFNLVLPEIVKTFIMAASLAAAESRVFKVNAQQSVQPTCGIRGLFQIFFWLQVFFAPK